MSNRDENVDLYILQAPEELRSGLDLVRSLIRNIAPDAVERTDYFQLPGYSYNGYDYDGMFVWFSYKKSNLRLHVRPPVLENHKSETSSYKQTKSIIEFPVEREIPEMLLKKLVQASIKVMKDKLSSTSPKLSKSGL